MNNRMSSLDNKVFDLKLAAKQISRNAKKLQKEEAKEIRQCWKHVVRGEYDIGKVHAENAVRNHNQSLDLLTLGARLQGVVNVLQAAVVQKGVTSAMQSVVASMASATRHMNLQSLAVTMNRFERMTNSLSTSQTYVSESLGRDGGQSAAVDQAGRLMAQIVDRVELDARNEMPVAETSQAAYSRAPNDERTCATADEIGLEEKLARLRDFHR